MNVCGWNGLEETQGEKDFLQFFWKVLLDCDRVCNLKVLPVKESWTLLPDKNASMWRDSRRNGYTVCWEAGITGTSLKISTRKARVGSDKELAEGRHVEKGYGILQVIYVDSRVESMCPCRRLWWCRKLWNGNKMPVHGESLRNDIQFPTCLMGWGSK